MPSPKDFFPPNQLASTRYDAVIRGLENSYKMAPSRPPFNLGNFLKGIPGIKLPVGAGTGVGALFSLAFEFAFPPPTVDEDAILQSIRNKAQEIQATTYSFTGGQSNGVLYNVTYTISNSGPKSCNLTTGVNPITLTCKAWGPIQRIRVEKTASNTSWNVVLSCRGINENGKVNYGTPQTYGGYYTSRGGQSPSCYTYYDAAIVSVARADGQPDTGGNPPATAQPIYSASGTYTFDTDTLNREVGQVEHPPNEPYRVQFQTPLDIFFPPAISYPEIPSDFQIDTGVDLTGLTPTLEPPIQPQPAEGIEVSVGTTSPPLLYAPTPNKPTDPQFEIPYEMRQRLNTNPVPLRTQFNQPVTNPPTPDYVISNQTAIQPITLNPTPKIIAPIPPPIEKPPEKTNTEELIKENADRALQIATGIALLTPIIQGIANNTTQDALETAAAAGTCRTTQPGGCTSNLVNGAADNINKNTNNKIDALGVTNALGQAVDIGLLKIIDDKLGAQIPNGGIGGKLSRFVNWAIVDRVTNIITMFAALHNVMMLSSSVKETFLNILDNLLQTGFNVAPNIFKKADENEAIDARQYIGSALDSFFGKLFGVTEWSALKAQWKAYSTIYSSSAQAYHNTREILNDSQELLNSARNYTAELGNALVDEGIISEDNWDYKDPKSKIKSKIFNKLERMGQGLEELSNKLEALEQVTATLLNITNTAKEIKENIEGIGKGIKDANEAAKKDRNAKIEGIDLPNFSLEDLF